MGGLLLAAERRPEVAQTLPERAPDLGQTLRAEHKQRDHENEQKVCWLKDVSDHSRTSLAAGTVRGLGKPKDPLNLNIPAPTASYARNGADLYCRTVTETLRLRLGTYG
jgi:hypothetical protein